MLEARSRTKSDAQPLYVRQQSQYNTGRCTEKHVSSFRRHLRNGAAAAAARLWQQLVAARVAAKAARFLAASWVRVLRREQEVLWLQASEFSESAASLRDARGGRIIFGPHLWIWRRRVMSWSEQQFTDCDDTGLDCNVALMDDAFAPDKKKRDLHGRRDVYTSHKVVRGHRRVAPWVSSWWHCRFQETAVERTSSTGNLDRFGKKAFSSSQFVSHWLDRVVVEWTSAKRHSLRGDVDVRAQRS